MRYWLSFDLGLRGKYEQLYTWLDTIGANECGDNVATFTTKKNIEQITKELSDFLGEDARIYLIVITSGKGKFIIGKRKRPLWAGYGGPGFETKEDK